MTDEREKGDSAGPTQRTRIAILILATTVIIPILLLVGLTTGILPVPDFIAARLAGKPAPEASARHYPAGTILYAWTTPLPSGEQRQHARDTWRRLEQIPEFQDLWEEFLDTLQDELGVAPEDLREWLGTDVSAGILGYDVQQERPSWAATASVRDRRAAQEFLETLTAHLAERRQTVFIAGSQGQFSTMASREEDLAFALSRQVMIVAGSPQGLEEMIRSSESDPSQTLAGAAGFQEARAGMAEERSASAYLNLLEAARQLEAAGPDWETALYAETLEQQGTTWAAAHGTILERALLVEATAPLTAHPALQTPALNAVHRELPADTAAFLSLAFDPDVDHWREAAAEHQAPEASLPGVQQDSQGETASDLLDAVLQAVREFTGIDPETGFLDHLGGEITLAGWTGRDDAQEPRFAVILPLRHGGQQAIQATMKEIETMTEDLTGSRFRSVELPNGDTARALESGLGYDPAYILQEERLTLATTLEAHRELGAPPSLGDTPEFLRAEAMMREPRQAALYLDLGRAAGWEEMRHADLDPDILEVARQTAGILTLSGHTPPRGAGDELSRLRLVLTLFPKAR